MAWFKLDDKFHSSEPVKRMPRSIRAAAVGLFALAGTWSADNLKDGYVPAFMVEELGCTLEQAEALVEVKLWRRVRDGYRFREWAPWQPTREEVEANRKAERDRKAAYRATKAGNAGAGPASVPVGQVRDSGHPRPVPSRPDPTNDKIPSVDNPPPAKPATGPTRNTPTKPAETGQLDVHRIATRVTEMTGTAIHPLLAAGIAQHYLERATTPPRLPTRYVLTCLRHEEPLVLENFLATERWSA